MNKMSEIASAISEISGDTKKASREFLRAFMDTAMYGIAKDGIVEVGGLGLFKIKIRKAGIGRNPKTGEKLQLPEIRSVYFRPCQEFIDNINE